MKKEVSETCCCGASIHLAVELHTWNQKRIEDDEYAMWSRLYDWRAKHKPCYETKTGETK